MLTAGECFAKYVSRMLSAPYLCGEASARKAAVRAIGIFSRRLQANSGARDLPSIGDGNSSRPPHKGQLKVSLELCRIGFHLYSMFQRRL